MYARDLLWITFFGQPTYPPLTNKIRSWGRINVTLQDVSCNYPEIPELVWVLCLPCVKNSLRECKLSRSPLLQYLWSFDGLPHAETFSFPFDGELIRLELSGNGHCWPPTGRPVDLLRLKDSMHFWIPCWSACFRRRQKGHKPSSLQSYKVLGASMYSQKFWRANDREKTRSTHTMPCLKKQESPGFVLRTSHWNLSTREKV